MPAAPERRKWSGATLSGILVAAAALALFIYALTRVGATDLASGLRQIGWGLPAILAVSAVRLAARTFAWRALIASPPPARDMLAATLAGEAVGNLLPLGPIAGEPAKVGYLRGRRGLGETAAALGLENVFYSLTIAIVIVLGMSVLVLTVALPDNLRTVAMIALVAMLALVISGILVLMRRPEAAGSMLDRLPPWLPVERLRALETKAYAFYTSAHGRLGRMLAFEALFHVFGIAEVFIVLWLLAGTPPSLVHAFILESAGRVINVAFRFVPMRVGVEEIGAEAAASVLGLASGTGVLLGVTRKVRVLIWTGVGVALIARRGMSVRSLGPEADAGA